MPTLPKIKSVVSLDEYDAKVLESAALTLACIKAIRETGVASPEMVKQSKEALEWIDCHTTETREETENTNIFLRFWWNLDYKLFRLKRKLIKKLNQFRRT